MGGSTEDRLRALEDYVEIVQLVSRYGPAIDSESTADAVGLWSEDGVYDVGVLFGGPVGYWTGRAEITGMVEGESVSRLRAQGCAHFTGIPHIEINGDTATGAGYSILFAYRPESDDFGVPRVTATSWELRREPEGWRITRRVNRNLDGDEAARALLGDAVAEWRRERTVAEPGIPAEQ